MLRAFALPVCALITLIGASSAFADMVQVRDRAGGETNNDATEGYFLEDTARGGDPWGRYYDEPDHFLYSGTFAFEADYGNGWTDLLTYCIDVGDGIEFGTQPGDTVGLPYELVPLTDIAGITPDEAIFLEVLWANAFSESITGANVTETSARSSAFQAIVWEVAQEDTLDMFHGHFRIWQGMTFTNSVASIAQGWIDKIVSGEWTERTPLYGLKSPISQDLITTVPEPASLLLALMPLCFLRRR